MTRYHPALVALHWLLAAMIVGALFMGNFVLAETPNDSPDKMLSLTLHMLVGVAVLVLMLARLVVRARTDRPPEADIGVPLLNRLGVAMHWALYPTVIALAASGVALSAAAGLPGIVFGGSGAPLPEDFYAFTPRRVHGALATILALLVVGHVAAFALHQFVRRDNLFSRMWFGPRG